MTTAGSGKQQQPVVHGYMSALIGARCAVEVSWGLVSCGGHVRACKWGGERRSRARREGREGRRLTWLCLNLVRNHPHRSDNLRRTSVISPISPLPARGAVAFGDAARSRCKARRGQRSYLLLIQPTDSCQHLLEQNHS